MASAGETGLEAESNGTGRGSLKDVGFLSGMMKMFFMKKCFKVDCDGGPTHL